MLTIFSIPKSFRGQIEVIQHNAIQSWLQIRPKCEVILFGDEEGTEETAREFRVRHVPDIIRNEYGTPLINSAFDISQQIGAHQLMCYVNADVILLSDFFKAVQQIHEHKSRFLLIGRRWDINLNQAWDFTKPDWESGLRAHVSKDGVLHPPTGIDYFVFPRSQYHDIPPFAVGRPAWDNWLIYRTRFLHIPVIDATEVVTAIHQNHGYEHVSQSVKGTYNGPEGNKNLELAGGFDYVFTLQDVDWVFTLQGLKRPKLTIQYLCRRMYTLPVLYPRVRIIAECLWHFMLLVRDSYRKVTKFLGIK
jgi:hypothetical protein